MVLDSIIQALLFFIWPFVYAKVYIYEDHLDAIKVITIRDKTYAKRVYSHPIFLKQKVVEIQKEGYQHTFVKRG